MQTTIKPHVMSSRWGVDIEGDVIDVQNVVGKINGSIRHPGSLFISPVGSRSVLRSASWDHAEGAADAHMLARSDLAFIRGCIDMLDGCGPIVAGTTYEFTSGGGFKMSRTTTLTIRIAKPQHEWATPQDFRELLEKADDSDALRNAIEDLTVDAPWADIYRCYESLKILHGNENKLLSAFPQERKRLENMRRTANSFRHVKTYDAPPNPMNHGEAVSLLKDIVKQSAAYLPSKDRDDRFIAGALAQIVAFHTSEGEADHLKPLALVSNPAEPDQATVVRDT